MLWKQSRQRGQARSLGRGGDRPRAEQPPRSHTGHASSLLTVSPGGRSPGHLPPDGERNPRLQTKQVSGVNQCVCTDARAQRASRALGSRTSVWGPVPCRAPVGTSPAPGLSWRCHVVFSAPSCIGPAAPTLLHPPSALPRPSVPCSHQDWPATSVSKASGIDQAFPQIRCHPLPGPR